MIYAMSDIHGCFDKYIKMLEIIGFNKNDTLYILGDVVDRGPDGIKILLDISKRKNVILLRGNHDDTALLVLSHLFSKKSNLSNQQLSDLIKLWSIDGGEVTLKQFLQCSEVEREQALSILKYSMLYEELEINGRKYFLSHTIPSKDKMRNFENCKIEDFLWGEPEYEKLYDSEKVYITGHTPTGFINPLSKGLIYKANNHVAIDCGTVFGFSLGCIRLDDMKEFYV